MENCNKNNNTMYFFEFIMKKLKINAIITSI